MATFDDYEVTFEYPENWELSIEGNASERTITLLSPDSAFWVMTIFDELVSTIAIIEQAERAFLDEYDDADVATVETQVFDFEGDGRTIDFSCLDLIGQARIEAFTTHRRTFFLMSQRSDVDDDIDEVFEAIKTSLRLPAE